MLLKIKMEFLYLMGYFSKYFRYIFIYNNRNINKRSIIGTPIIVLDSNTDKSFYFSSISEAARHFNTYPKTI